MWNYQRIRVIPAAIRPGDCSKRSNVCSKYNSTSSIHWYALMFHNSNYVHIFHTPYMIPKIVVWVMKHQCIRMDRARWVVLGTHIGTVSWANHRWNYLNRLLASPTSLSHLFVSREKRWDNICHTVLKGLNSYITLLRNKRLMRKASIFKVINIWFSYGIPIGSRRKLSDYLGYPVGSDEILARDSSSWVISDAARDLLRSDGLG
jgi:hypothetical protein